MIGGILFILAGILIALFPELLSFIVATFLIIIGVFILFASYNYKKASRRLDNPFVDFILKF